MCLNVFIKCIISQDLTQFNFKMPKILCFNLEMLPLMQLICSGICGDGEYRRKL